MSKDMLPSGSSWNLKPLVAASSRLTSLKGYVASHTPSPPTRHTCSGTPRDLGGSPGGEQERKSWRAWAGQKIRGKQRGNDSVGNTEVINVFPGWAARRYAQGTSTEGGLNQCPQFKPFLIRSYQFHDLSRWKCLCRVMRLATGLRRTSVALKRLSFV